MMSSIRSAPIRPAVYSAVILSIWSITLTAQERLLSTEELTAKAEVIAVGEVKEVKPEWNESRTSIRTRVILAVDQVVKGTSPGPVMILYVPGGEVDGVGEIYSHMPAFHRQEQVLVFAKKDSRQNFRVTGGQQGKLLLKADASGKRFSAGHRPLDELTAEIRAVVKQSELHQEIH